MFILLLILYFYIIFNLCSYLATVLKADLSHPNLSSLNVCLSTTGLRFRKQFLCTKQGKVACIKIFSDFTYKGRLVQLVRYTGTLMNEFGLNPIGH